MTNERSGRVLDKGFEEGIANSAQDGINKGQEYARRKNDEFECMVQEHPKAFVLGSFVGGFALGTLLSKGK